MRNTLTHVGITSGSDTVQSMSYEVIKYAGDTFTRRVYAKENQNDHEATVRWTLEREDSEGFYPVKIHEAVVALSEINKYNPFTEEGYLPRKNALFSAVGN